MSAHGTEITFLSPIRYAFQMENMLRAAGELRYLLTVLLEVLKAYGALVHFISCVWVEPGGAILKKNFYP